MQKIAQTLEILSNKSDNLYPIFISVDPQRDTPKELKSFLNEFDNRIIGLTGKSEEIKKVAKEYKIYYSKNYLDIDENDHEHNHHNHYLIDHTALFYLMDENGEYVKYYPNNITPEEMAKDIASYL